MVEYKINTTKKDVIWNYIGTIVSISSNFILIPLLLIFLSSEQIGLWYVFTAIAGFAQLLEFGFTSTLSRNILYSLSGKHTLVKTGLASDGGLRETDWHLFNVVLKTSRIIYSVIGVLGLFLSATFGTVYIVSVTNDFSIEHSFLSWIIFVASIFTNLYFLYCLTFLRGIGDVAGENRSKTIARLGQLLITAILLIAGLQILAAAIGYFMYGLLLRLFASRAFNKHIDIKHGISSDIKKISKDEVKETLRTVSFVASRDGLVSVAWYGATQAMTLLCSAFLGLSEAGAYSVMIQLTSGIYNVSSAYMRSFFPSFQSAYVKGDLTVQRSIIARGLSCYIAMFALGTACVTVFLPLLALFKSDFICDPVLYLGLSIYMFLLNQHSLFCNVIVNMNEIPYFKAYLISTLAGLVLSCILCAYFKLGAWGLVLGQMLPQLAYNNWYWPVYVMKKIKSTYFSTVAAGLQWWFSKIKGKLNLILS